MFIDRRNMEKEKNRSEIDVKDTWDLSKIFKTDKEFEEAFGSIDELVNKVVSFKGKIMESSDSLYNFYKSYEKMDRLLTKLFMYASLNRDADTTNTKNQALKMRVLKKNEDISNATSFISSEMVSLDYDLVLSYIKEDRRLEEYAFDLEKTFRYKEHTLSESEEAIITLATNAMGTGSDAFNYIDNTDINLGEIKDSEGNLVKLTNSNYIKYMNSKDRSVRIDAFIHMYKYFEGLKNTVSACLKGNIKENFFLSRVKKYSSPLEASLYSDNIDISVYRNLIEVVHDNMNLMYDYMALRKKVLQLDELHMYDIYMDLVRIDNDDIPFEKGKEIVFNALKPLGDTYINDLKKAFDERWIDIYPNKGKKSGAYSWGSYDTYPYLLLNYNNTTDSVVTMAHELGHSMHSYYSDKNQNYFTSQYSIFLAEIASTVNEVLLNDYMYKNAKDNKEKAFYLTEMLDKIRTTIYRQTMFAEFEMIMHDKEDKGIPLTEEEFSNSYYNLNKLYYGDNVVSDDLIRYEWARIPHFYTSFYVYKYATGLSAALALATDILNEKEGARDKYLEFLSSGSSDYPLNILKKVGVDMTTKEPVEKALNVFKDKLEELKKLV